MDEDVAILIEEEDNGPTPRNIVGRFIRTYGINYLADLCNKEEDAIIEA